MIKNSLLFLIPLIEHTLQFFYIIKYDELVPNTTDPFIYYNSIVNFIIVILLLFFMLWKDYYKTYDDKKILYIFIVFMIGKLVVYILLLIFYSIYIIIDEIISNKIKYKESNINLLNSSLIYINTLVFLVFMLIIYDNADATNLELYYMGLSLIDIIIMSTIKVISIKRTIK